MNHGVLQYLDDTLIHAPTKKLLYKRLELFLERMYLFGVFLKPKKCILWSKKITFLGWRISGNGVSVDLEKTKAISSVPTPKTAGELQQYLAAMQWLKSKMPNYNKVVAPLQEILNACLEGTRRTKSAASKVSLSKFG